MEIVSPLIGLAVKAIADIVGDELSSHNSAKDVESIRRTHVEEMKRKDQENKAQREHDNAANQKRLDKIEKKADEKDRQLSRYQAFITIALVTSLPMIILVLWVSGVIGDRYSSPGPAVDISSILQSHETAMAQNEEEHRIQQERAHTEFQQRLDEMSNATTEVRQRMQEEFHREQEKIEEERNADRYHYEGRIADLADGMKEAEERHKERIADLADSMKVAEERMQELAQQLEKPIKDREEKLSFVNGLKLKVRQTESLLLVGPKGMGKSTFLWLLNKGDSPKRTIRDGTVEMIHLNGFVDSIGLRGWTPEELLKLLVLMIYDGIPKDLIIFTNDRVDLPVSSLGLLGINNPMIVIMSSDFWKFYMPAAGEKKKINLIHSDGGVRRVQPEEDLNMVYNLPVYEEIKQFHLGTPVTHHDDLGLLVDKRGNAGIQPFQFLLEKLGTYFMVSMENEYNTEALFRFIYIYEKKYEKNRLKFMNQATLLDFV